MARVKIEQIKDTSPTAVGARVDEMRDPGHPGIYRISWGNPMLTFRNPYCLRTLRLAGYRICTSD